MRHCAPVRTIQRNALPESFQHTVAFAEDTTGDQQTTRSTLPVQQPVLVIPEHERKSYPTDLTDAHWQRIVPLFCCPQLSQKDATTVSNSAR